MERRFQVGPKIDLDTCGAAALLGWNYTKEQVEVLPQGQASEEDLANPDVICIEVGGAGRWSEGNFDHHGTQDLLPSATMQVVLHANRWLQGHPLAGRYVELAAYIDRLDTKGPKGMEISPGFPTFSDVFAGILLTTKEPVDQFRLGWEIVHEMARYGFNPYGRIPVDENSENSWVWAHWARVKAENDRQVTQALKKARWEKTSAGLRLGILEISFIGAVGALYGAGAQVAIVLNPNFQGFRKFTVAGNDVRVDAVLPKLNELEPGWGGPATGTIIGSPRGQHSKLSLAQVVRIVKETL